ncbi:hypothetical protein J3998_08315 [Thiomicrorhabdus sp. 6S2-11]|uniref:YD repeat-containing protein n=1 Tax=Thiomicrorhabdus marina TaxID=2818442 RepID=A0ABS3Q5I5_9GAMM|nr:hypothetical protein [Thiomicrorhabdus marina]MBO1927582.1 hypothetical protein [Thiomicrorhabdus marina]
MKLNTQLKAASIAVITALGLTACGGGNGTAETADTTAPAYYAVILTDDEGSVPDDNADGNVDYLSVAKYEKVDRNIDLFLNRLQVLGESKMLLAPVGYIDTQLAYDGLTGAFEGYEQRTLSAAKDTYSEYYPDDTNPERYDTDFIYNANNLLSNIDDYFNGVDDGSSAIEVVVNDNGTETTTSQFFYRGADEVPTNGLVPTYVNSVVIDNATGLITQKIYNNDPGSTTDPTATATQTPSGATYSELNYEYDSNNRLVKLQSVQKDGTYISTSYWDYSNPDYVVRTIYNVNGPDPAASGSGLFPNETQHLIESAQMQALYGDEYKYVQIYRELDIDAVPDGTKDRHYFYTYNDDGQMLTSLYDGDLADTRVNRYTVTIYNTDGQATSYSFYEQANDLNNDGSVDTLNSPSSTTDILWFSNEPTCADIYDDNGLTPTNTPTNCSINMPPQV